MHDDDRIRILHMIDAAQAVEQFIRGKKREDAVYGNCCPSGELYRRRPFVECCRMSGKPPVGTWLNLPPEGSAVGVMGAV